MDTEKFIRQALKNFETQFGLSGLFNESLLYPFTTKYGIEIKTPADLVNAPDRNSHGWHIPRLNGNISLWATEGKRVILPRPKLTRHYKDKGGWGGRGNIILFGIDANLIPLDEYVTSDFLKMTNMQFWLTLEFNHYEGLPYTSRPEKAYCIAFLMAKILGCEPAPIDEAMANISTLGGFDTYTWEYRGEESKLEIKFITTRTDNRPFYDCFISTMGKTFGPGCGAI